MITGLDELPRSLLFYRQLLQWLGGMGIIVLAVAVLPMLGVGGMQLYRAESPGPVKDTKLTPRITETARALWLIYLVLTLACAAAYWIAGMSLFDAICHAFSTVAIGGFSTHDASLGHFASGAIESVAIVFMIISGINFGLHFLAWRRPSLYFTDREVRTYLGRSCVRRGTRRREPRLDTGRDAESDTRRHLPGRLDHHHHRLHHHRELSACGRRSSRSCCSSPRSRAAARDPPPAGSR